MRVVIFILLFSVFFVKTALGQNSRPTVIDSLQNELQKAKSDTSTLKILNAISRAWQSKNEYEKAMKYAKDAKTLSEKLLADGPSGEQAGTILRESGKAIVNIGVIETYNGNYTEGLKNQLAALKIFEQINYTRGIAPCFINIGVLYYYQGNNYEALKNYLSALEIFKESGDKHNMALAYNNIGGIYVNQHNYTEALKNLYASLKISEQLKDTSGMAGSYNNIGEAYFKQGNYSEALKNHLATLQMMESFSDRRGIILSYNNIGSDYASLGKYNEALICLNKALRMATELNYRESVKDIYYSFSQYYQKTEDFKKALEYNALYAALKDSLANQNIGTQMAEMRTKYETEKKDKEIALLSKNKEIQSMKIEKQRTTLNYLIAGFATLLIFSLIAFSLYSQKKKTAFERRVSQTELKALRSQMNPHFTFNVLNSIQYYIGGNDMDSAELYLNKFSTLIRMILDQSRTSHISLTQEIRMLRLYLELEQMLFEDKFEYRFEIDEKLSPEKISIPGMLIQPIVENAIRHGIEHKKGEAIIDISVTSHNSTLLCKVTDNGIGRRAAEKLRMESSRSHKSLGTSITRERMETLSLLYNINFDYRTEDLFDSEGKPCGTAVTMEIPFLITQS